MGSWTKVLLLLLVNIAIAGSALYFFDFMQIIDYRRIFSNFQGLAVKAPLKIEDRFLLEQEELNKKWELLSIKEVEISNQNSAVISNNMELETLQAELQKEREAFINEQTLIAVEQEEKNTYEIKITEVAQQINSMPPEAAAELLNLQDDFQVADIFKKMEELAAANGQASTVPYLLTLINREKAAAVQSLMLTRTSL